MIDLYFLSNKRKKNFIIIFFGLILSGLLEGLSIGLIPLFINLITDPEVFQQKILRYINLDVFFSINYNKQVLIFSFLIFFSFLIKNIYVFLLYLYEGNFLRRFMVELTTDLFKNYLYMDYTKLKNTNSSILLRNLTTQCESIKIYYHEIIFLLKESIECLSILILLFIFSSYVAVFIFLIMFAASALFFFSVSKKIKEKSKIIQSLISDQIRSINEGLSAIKEAKIYSKEKMIHDIFYNRISEAEHLGVFNHVLNNTPRLVLELLTIGSMSLALTLIFFSGSSLTSALPVLSLIVVALIRLLPSFNIINS